jgi:hypothetical protein
VDRDIGGDARAGKCCNFITLCEGFRYGEDSDGFKCSDASGENTRKGE